MQKIFKFSVIVFLSAYAFLQTKEKPIETNVILLQNVEALAFEETDMHVGCYNKGNVTLQSSGVAGGLVGVDRVVFFGLFGNIDGDYS